MSIPDDHYVKVGSINTRYWTGGEGSPVVLVHGMGGSAAGWLPSFSAFCSEHQVFALDIVGHGRTDKPDPARYNYRLTDLKNFISDFMNILKINQAHIVGHSMGGAVSLMLAINDSSRVQKLVLSDAGGLGKELHPFMRVMSIPVLGEILASRLLYTSDVKKYGEQLRSSARNATYITDELIENLHAVEQFPTKYKMFLKVLRDGVNWTGQKKNFYEPILERLPTVTNQTLLIWGRQDDLIPLAHAEIAAKRLPNARLEVIENSGHVPMFDQPETFNRLVLEFLRD